MDRRRARLTWRPIPCIRLSRAANRRGSNLLSCRCRTRTDDARRGAGIRNPRAAGSRGAMGLRGVPARGPRQPMGPAKMTLCELGDLRGAHRAFGSILHGRRADAAADRARGAAAVVRDTSWSGVANVSRGAGIHLRRRPERRLPALGLRRGKRRLFEGGRRPGRVSSRRP
jgi:hypothetical protein